MAAVVKKKDHRGETMKIKEHIWEILRRIFEFRTCQPKGRKEIKRRIEDLEKNMENDEKTRNQ